MMILSAWILLLLVHNSRVARKDQLLSRSAEKRAGNILVIDPLLQIMVLYKNLNCIFNLFQYFQRLCRACTATTQRLGGWTQCSPTHRSLLRRSTARSIPLSIHLEKNNALFGEFDTKPVKSSLTKFPHLMCFISSQSQVVSSTLPRFPTIAPMTSIMMDSMYWELIPFMGPAETYLQCHNGIVTHATSSKVDRSFRSNCPYLPVP